jgi:hypothetical protein
MHGMKGICFGLVSLLRIMLGVLDISNGFGTGNMYNMLLHYEDLACSCPCTCVMLIWLFLNLHCINDFVNTQIVEKVITYGT